MSLKSIDTAICQAPRASGRDCSPSSSGQLVDCRGLIITLLEREHCPLSETSDITYGWNEARRGQTRQEMRWPCQLSRLPWRCDITAEDPGCCCSCRRGLSTRITAAAMLRPQGKSLGPSNPPGGGCRKSKEHWLWSNESLSLLSLLFLGALLPGWEGSSMRAAISVVVSL